MERDTTTPSLLASDRSTGDDRYAAVDRFSFARQFKKVHGVTPFGRREEQKGKPALFAPIPSDAGGSNGLPRGNPNILSAPKACRNLTRVDGRCDQLFSSFRPPVSGARPRATSSTS